MLLLRPVERSQSICAVSHDGHDLFVLFHSKKLYQYGAVPKELFVEFMAAPSMGVFLHSKIKATFSCWEINEPYRIQSELSLRELLPGPSFCF